MREFLSWRRDRTLVTLVVSSVVLNGAAWALLRWRIPPTDELIPVHYTIYFGIDRLGSWRELFVVPLSGTVILFLNTLLSGIVYRRERLISLLFSITTLLTQIVLLIAALFLVVLNFS